MNKTYSHIKKIISFKINESVLNFHLKSEKRAERWAQNHIISNNKNPEKQSRLFFQRAKDIYPTIALKYGKHALEYYFDPSYIKVYAKRLEYIGQKKEASELIKKIDGLAVTRPNEKNISESYSILAKNRDSLSAINLHRFILDYLPNTKYISAKKYFTQFKSVDPKSACEIGAIYILNNPQDIKFAQVYLRIAEKNLCEKEFKRMQNVLYERFEDTLYGNYILKSRIKDLITEFGESLIVIDKINSMPQLKATNNIISTLIFSACKDKYSPLSKYIANKMEALELNDLWSRRLADYNLSIGNISNAKIVIDKAEPSELVLRKQKTINSFSNLHKKSYLLDNKSKHTDDYSSSENGVLYLLHNRLPYNSGGYATRSHGILTSINKNWHIQGISRLGYPHDREGFENESFISHHDIDGIRYHALKADGNAFGQIPLGDYISEYADELKKKCLIEKPAILHAASNYMNGLAAVKVANELGIKSVYEVRGLWEITRISREPEWKNSEYYQMMVNLEAQAAIEADHVFTLTSALKAELVKRGVDESKIDLLPNGVDSSRFIPKSRNEALSSKLGIANKVVIGFLGSVVQYEGVEYIIQAASILKNRGITNFAVLIVGDGAVLTNIKSITSELGMNEFVTFTGRVPHDEIEDYYSVVDICPLPRKGLPVCEMVSPLKPFEAMAMGKVVVSSDVAALAEIINDQVTGLLHKKDDAEDLADKIGQLITDEELRSRLGKAARKWVVAERDWKVIAKRVDHVYQNLLGK